MTSVLSASVARSSFTVSGAASKRTVHGLQSIQACLRREFAQSFGRVA
jgi:hypothetical protein